MTTGIARVLIISTFPVLNTVLERERKGGRVGGRERGGKERERGRREGRKE